MRARVVWEVTETREYEAVIELPDDADLDDADLDDDDLDVELGETLGGNSPELYEIEHRLYYSTPELQREVQSVTATDEPLTELLPICPVCGRGHVPDREVASA